MRSGELARRLGVSDPLIRKWSGQYAEFLSRRSGRPKPGQDRDFDDSDVLVMATVAHLRNEGLSHDQITQQLADRWRVESVPPLPDPEVEEARRRVDLVPADRLARALDRIDQLQGDITRLIAERDRALQDATDTRDKLADLREELGAARARAELLDQELQNERRKRRGIFGG